MKLLIALLGIGTTASSMGDSSKQTVTCETRKHGTDVINRDHPKWTPHIISCRFDGSFVFYAAEHFKVCHFETI